MAGSDGRGWMSLRPTDYLLAGYVGVLTLVLLLRGPWANGHAWLLVSHGLFVGMLVLFGRLRENRGLGRALHTFYPLLLLAGFYGAIGVGASQVQPDSDFEDAGGEDESDLMIPIELGVRWVNDKADADWGALFQVRDRVTYRADDDKKVRNDWSVGVGLSLYIGG